MSSCGHCNFHSAFYNDMDTGTWKLVIDLCEMRTPSCEMLVWPVWYENSYLLRVIRWCDHCDMRTPSCETLVWPLWYENSYLWDTGVTIVIWEHLRVRHRCDLRDISYRSQQCLTRSCSQNTMVTAASDTKEFSYQKSHTSVSHEGVLISQRIYQRLTRRCCHITKVTPASHTKVFSYHEGHTCVSHEGVLISQWSHHVWPVWYENSYLLRVIRWCDHCDMRTPSCETLVWPSWYENTFVWDAGVTFVIWELLPVRHWCDHCDMRTPSCETQVWPSWYENTFVWDAGVTLVIWQHLRVSITKATSASHKKVLSYHKGHTNASTRRDSHII
jgi:hypothetical protein